jgi:hypothetical protein
MAKRDSRGKSRRRSDVHMTQSEQVYSAFLTKELATKLRFSEAEFRSRLFLHGKDPTAYRCCFANEERNKTTHHLKITGGRK